MTSIPRRLGLTLLHRALRDEALAGDLLELATDRRPQWLWRQIAAALVRQYSRALRENPRGTVEGALVGAAILVLLAFSSLVAAILLLRLFTLADLAWIADSGRLASADAIPARLAAAGLGALVSFAAGRRLARCRRRGIAPLALGCAAIVTALASLDLYLFVPTPGAQPFATDAVWLLAALAVVIAGLSAGIESRASCVPLPWS